MTTAPLYHVSDQPGIAVFEPRPCTHGGAQEDLVWAIDSEHLPNYLFPRDCPRVTFFATDETDSADIDRLLCGTSARRVVAIESGWLQRVQSERLHVYEFDPGGFTLMDGAAGYYVSQAAVKPVSERESDDILGELLRCDLELRVMPSLWKLREAVIASTLGFSIVRMRNAQPPAEGYGAYYPLP